MSRTGNPKHFDLRARARQAMIDEGFAPDFSAAARADAAAIESRAGDSMYADVGVRDLRGLLWSSIDNVDSRDLDQIEYAEHEPDGSIRVLVGIADVTEAVSERSAIDGHAARNTTTVYAGVATFPMLPEELSTGATSLLEGQERHAIVVDFPVREDGSLGKADIYRALVRNAAQLDYESTGNWLDNRSDAPPKVKALHGLEDQLRLQDGAAVRLRELRERRGALELETIEANPVTVDGKVVDLAIEPATRARYLIENFMIAANTAMAAFLLSNGSPSLGRIVRTPERWPRIVEIARSLGDSLPDTPDARALAAFLDRRRSVDPLRFPDLSLSIVKLLGPGEYTVLEPGSPPGEHFGLAVTGYTHSTAPNRRFADLVTQRLLKAIGKQAPEPYSRSELDAIAGRCTERDHAARKVQRLMRKVVAAQLLGGRVGELFDAIVTGVSEKGVFARLIRPPAEGRIIRGERGCDVGDKIRVRLVSTDVARGYIDFERVQ